MEFIGKVCPYCKSEFKENDDVVICSVCEMPHHKECWIENKACTTFGCTGTVMGVDNYNGLFCRTCGAAYTDGEEMCASCGNVISKSHEPEPMYAYAQAIQQSLGYDKDQYINEAYSVNYNQPKTNYNYDSYSTSIDEDMQTFVAKNQEYFSKKFQKFNLKNSKVSWNWASAFFGSYWYAYRKMYLIQFLYYISYFFIIGFLGILMVSVFSTTDKFIPGMVMAPLVILFVPFVLSGIFGNYIYKRHVEKHVKTARNMEVYMKQDYLMKKGGTSSGAVWLLIGIRILIKIIT